MAHPVTNRGDLGKVNLPDVVHCTYISVLGEGAFGKVYLVTDKKSNTLKAVKTYNLKDLKADYRVKFAPREVDILLKMSHPNIIGVERMCKAGSCLYMVMEYAQCKDLEHYIHKACPGVVHENQARIWTRQMANALEYLHEIGVVHRDIKCENILISRHLNAKLADFGFSRFLHVPRELSNTFCGTATYVAPEIIKNKPYNPKAADIWSLGVVLYRILNKSYPFGNAEVRNKDRLRKQETKRYTFSRTFEVSFGAKQLISHMFEPNPRHRISARAIQAHSWIQRDAKCRVTTVEEKDALKRGKLKVKEFSQKYPVVQKLTDPDPNVHVIEEYSEKIYAEAGPLVSEANIHTIVCKSRD